MAQVFRKRPGTTDKGKVYEVLNVASLVINLVSDKDVEDFHLSCNDENFGAFDDIVVETKRKNGTETHAVQLKHSDRGNLYLKQLTRSTGDFSIVKYFQSVQSLKIANAKFILYTNLKFNVTDGTVTHLDGENFKITVTKMSDKDAFKISQKLNCYYKFSIVEGASHQNSSKLELYETFFDNFFLYVAQEGTEELKKSVPENFKTLLSGSDVECDQYIKFLREWDSKVGTKPKLNKSWMTSTIALKVLSSRIRPLSFNHDNVIRDIKIEILREAIEAFDVTVFGQQSYDDLKELWHDQICQLPDLKSVNKFREKYQLNSHISDISKADALTLSLLLWLMGKCPLILTYDTKVDKILELCSGEKFVLLKDDGQIPGQISAFQTLADLKSKTAVYDKLVKHFGCSLQGKQEILVNDLIKDGEEILNVLKTDDLLEMCKGQCAIGEAKEKLSEPYIERRLFKNAIDIKVLDNFTKPTAVVLEGVKIRDLQKRLGKYHLINVNDYLNSEKETKLESELPALSTNTIYVSERRCDYARFNAVCKKTADVEHFHQFRVRTDGNLEWIRTRGDIDDIEKHKLSKCYPVHERDLRFSKSENSVNILVSDPGMGKSELMKSFKTKCFPKHITIIVDPKDVYSFSKTASANYLEAFRKFLFDVKYKTLSDRDKAIFRIFLKNNKTIYIWDALDELTEKHKNIVTDIITELSGNDCVQWLTSRCHLQDTLQRQFKALSLNLTKFNDDEQRNYIRKRLTDDVDPVEPVETVIAKIESNFVLVEHKDILGIPLQLFMLTELFRQDRATYSALLNKFFPLTDLYSYFIEEKLNIHFRDKLGVDLNTANAELMVQSQKDQIVKEYTNAALRLLFPDTILRRLGISDKENLEKIHESHTNIGLVTEIKGQIPSFLHNSFAEYLAARHFSKKLEHREIPPEVMFDPKYNNVRFFFDLLLAGDSKAHIAVLYKDFGFIKGCNDEQILKCKDLGGRSALHLACSWGQRYHELDVKLHEGKYLIDDERMFSTLRDKAEPLYLETIDCLLEKCNISEPDEIFGMTPRQYAREIRCLSAEMRVIMKHDGQQPIERDHVLNMVYYSACYGFYDEFKYFLGCFFELFGQNWRDSYRNGADCIQNHTRMTLLFTAGILGHYKIVEYLARNGASVNFAIEDGVSPLIAACKRGHYGIVEFLVKADADINSRYRDQLTPLYVALQNGYDKIAKYLVQAGADMNLAYKDGFTLLNAACKDGNNKIAEFLIGAGADLNLANKDGFTPLITASKNGRLAMAESLVKAGADKNLANKDGFTPLIAASREGHHLIAKLLVDSSADINFANKHGFTALNTASGKGYLEIVELLVKAPGADINLANRAGATPLISACHQRCANNEEVVRVLVEAGADINRVSKGGDTPLNTASVLGHSNIVKFLTEKGANVNLPNKDGFTPLLAACWKGHMKVVKVLVEAGADVNLANKEGLTPLNAATVRNHRGIAEYLLNLAEVPPVNE